MPKQTIDLGLYNTVTVLFREAKRNGQTLLYKGEPVDMRYGIDERGLVFVPDSKSPMSHRQVTDVELFSFAENESDNTSEESITEEYHEDTDHKVFDEDGEYQSEYLRELRRIMNKKDSVESPSDDPIYISSTHKDKLAEKMKS